MRYRFFALLACGLVAGFAPSGLRAEEGAYPATITQAQPPLPAAPLEIVDQSGHSHHFTVELARTPREQEIGEMFRTVIPPGQGMLFVWPHEQDSAMWMRNTLVPLDIVFIDGQNRIHAIAERAVPLSEGIISSQGPVRAVLELPGGTTEQAGLVVGDRITSAALPPLAGGTH